MAPSEVPGELLGGKYRLERILARGRSAVVWQARHAVTGRTAALKLFVEPVANLPRARERMLLEARVSALAAHPNLLPIDDVLELEDGRAALVMERLLGESLRTRIEREIFAVADLHPLFGPALEALERAHAAGLVHRDLKPDNLFVTSEQPPRLVVLDFGIAKLAGETGLDLTSTGVSMGTPFYMAPEQLFGDDDVDWRADVWAVGVVLFEALTGRRPTEAGNLGQLLKLVSSRALPRLDPGEIQGHVAVAALIQRMLDVRKAGRPPLAEVRHTLQAASAGPEPRRPRRWPLAAAGMLLAGVASLLLPAAPPLGAKVSPLTSRVAIPPTQENPSDAGPAALANSALDAGRPQRAAKSVLPAVASGRSVEPPLAASRSSSVPPPLHERPPF